MNARFMREAIRLSFISVRQNRGGPFGAVVVHGNQIVGRGWNRVTSSNDPTAHAEICAIRQASRKLGRFALQDCDLYTSCEPCPMCLAAVYWARIRSLYFSTTRRDAARIGFDDALIYRELRLAVPRRKLPMKQMLRNEALPAFQEWSLSPRKIPY